MASTWSTRQGRRNFLLALIGASLLAGCAARPGGRPNSDVPLGTNKVAVLVPLSGPDAMVGRALGDAARMALIDSGSAPFSLTLIDTAAGGSAAAAGQALSQRHGLILGPLRSEEVALAAPMTQAARVPMIAFTNDSLAAGPGTFVLGFTPSQAVERVVGHAAASGVRRFAGLIPATAYGQRSAQALQLAVQRAGGQLVGIETYASPGEARAAARRLAGRPHDAVLIADSGRVATLIAPALRSGVRILGTELWAGANHGGTPRLRGTWYAAPAQGQWEQFVQRYRARFGGPPPPRIAALGYDAVLLAVRAAREWKPGRRFPLGAIEDRAGFSGVDGTFRFRPDNVAQRAFEVRQVTASGSALVSAAPTRFP